jgi:hypothetical protein
MSLIEQLFFPRKTGFNPRKHRQACAFLIKVCQPMSLSSVVARTILCCLAAAFPASLFGASTIHADGPQRGIAGALPGDQLHPQLSLNSGGGFIVWDDNVADGQGQGVRAAALDSNFSMVQAPFRVNQIRALDQERPQVALLNGGGAIFVWQGGPRSGQRIYARFLSSSNSWATGDTLVNGFTRSFQINPVVATLTDGNVVVAWSSFNQQSSNSFHDVYAQRFSSAGQKIGSEFLVNEFASYNQRTPAIAALSDGRFVLTWISEQQRQENSVDAYARIFNADATPAGGEFLVNGSVSNVCANPSVAALGGGFIIAWGERDIFVRTNGWNAFARTFNGAGSGGEVQMLNSYTFGDQYAPRVSSSADGAFVLWTSLGQDGSREGIYGRFLDENGGFSSEEFRVNTTTVNGQLHPGVAADHQGRYVAAWASFAGVTRGLDLAAQVYASADFVPGPSVTNYVPPLPQDLTNSVPPGSTNGVPTNSIPLPPTLNFPPPPSSSGEVLSNAFARTKGVYNGLLYDSNGVIVSSSGYFSAKTTDKGAFSAKLLIGGRSYVLSGQFDANGEVTRTIPRPGMSALTVHLQLDLTGGDQIRGNLSTGTWSAELVADRQVFSAAGNPAPQAGNYTLVIPGDTQDSSCPGGDGFGTVRVDGNGVVLWSCTLADGTRLTQSSTISKQGTWPLYAAPYVGRGVILSWVQFANQADSDLGGRLIWIKPGGVIGKYYPRGFTNDVLATGSMYRAPTSGARALNMSDGTLVLSGGGLHEPLTMNLTLGINNRVTVAPGTKLTLSLTPATGLFKGSALNPATGKTMTFQGALFKKANVGVGYFLGTDQSGEVYLSPAP